MSRAHAAILVPLLLLSACKGKPSRDELLSSLRAAVDSTHSYRVQLDATTWRESARGPQQAMTGRAELAAALPEKMALTAHASMAPPRGGKAIELDGDLVLDGQTAWIAMRTNGAHGLSNVLKLDQKKVAPEDDPLLIGFSVNGIGLRGGAEYLGTLRSLLEDYSFGPEVTEATFEGARAWRLEGKLELDRLLARLPKTDPGFLATWATLSSGTMAPEEKTNAEKTLADAISMTVRDSQRLALYVSRKDRLPLGWELGSAGQTSSRVKVTRYEPGAQLSAETFVPEPYFAGAVDQSADLAAARQRSRQALQDPSVAREAIASLKLAIEKRLSSPSPAR
jgi:outer membrane lipoprotein-sorting protein